MKSATTSDCSVKLTLTSESGEQLRFELYDPKKPRSAECVYAVLRTRLTDNRMRASYGQRDEKFCIIYVGDTDDLAQRVEQHYGESWFSENGATHVCFLEEPDPEVRAAIRRRLVKYYAPDCNSARDAYNSSSILKL